MEKMLIDGKHVLKYDQKNAKAAIDLISRLHANMGSTNIMDPVKEAISISEGDGKFTKYGQKRIFLLTDGFIDGKVEDLLEITRGTNRMRFYTFGIGDDCDKNLVK